MTTTPRVRTAGLVPLAADLVCVLALAVAGKQSHEPGEAAWTVLAIAWPFAVAAGLAHAWLVRRARPADRGWPEGATAWVITFVLGMALRGVSGRGLAPAFLVVAGAFLAATMLGWRLVALLVRRMLG